jgi:thiol-disulfide isomerase/thioredoxin/glucose/arabinose dehydrogenase
VGRVRAPELSGAGGWIGVREPLTLTALTGKIVVLDFWTSCCVNCLRVLEELRPLEGRFADEAVFIGIHSPKFPREHEHRAVVQAVERLGITHPVLDDPDLATWRQYGVRGWPTVVVVDPTGYLVGAVSGEGCGPVLTTTIEQLITAHEADGTLDRGPIAGLALAPTVSFPRVLAFPGKVAVHPDGDRLVVADTGHDRVMVCDLAGRVEQVFELFSRPQGVRFDGDDILVCDTGHDRVVRVPLGGGSRTVIAAELASPWDVVVDTDGSCVIAEAGRHRLWRASPGGTAVVVAGTGEEDLRDGPAGDARFAQPSGLSRMPGGVALVDAEASALRVMTDDGRLVTLVGQGLFDWGASDGGPESAALQHPLGVASAGPTSQTVYVADTFNSLLRAWTGPSLRAADSTTRTLPAIGLEEPGGLDVLPDGRLVVADTNHHRIVFVDPEQSTVDPLALDESWVGTIAGAPISGRVEDVVALPYALDLGPYALDHSAGPPVRIEVHAAPGTLLASGPRVWALDGTHGTLELRCGQPGSGTVVIEIAMSVCDDLQCTVLRSKTRHDLTVSEAEQQTSA